MINMRTCVHQATMILIVAILFLNGVLSERCNLDSPKEFTDCPADRTVILPGQEVVLKCSTKSEIEMCVWIGPTGTNVRPLADKKDYQPALSSPDNKFECNIRIVSVKFEDNGVWTCQPFVKGVATPDSVSGSVIVAVEPRMPPVIVFQKFNDQGELIGEPQENPLEIITTATDEVQLTCEIRNIRPGAEISWLIGEGDEEKNITLNANHLESRVASCPDGIPQRAGSDKEIGCSTSIRKLPIKFTGDQNGKAIRCMSEHIAYGERATTEKRAIIRVEYKPEFMGKNEPFIYDTATPRSYKIRVRANPAPEGQRISLKYGQRGKEKHVYSNDQNGDNNVRLIIKPVNSPARDVWEAEIIIKQDANLDMVKPQPLVLTVTNDQGSSRRTITLETEAQKTAKEEPAAVTDSGDDVISEPEVREDLSGGAIAGIVIAVAAIVIIIAIIVIARMQGLLCFEDKEHVELRSKEGDTESAGQHDPKQSNRFSTRLTNFYSSLVKPKKYEVDAEKGTIKEESVPLESKIPEVAETEKPEATEEEKKPEVEDKKEEPEKDSVVYAELDLKTEGKQPPKKSPEETTEYAEIVPVVKNGE